MPYNSETGAYERRTTTVIDATPDGDTVAVAIDTKLDTAADDAVLDLNHHKTNGNHYPATSVDDTSRYLDQSPAGVVSWKNGAPVAISSTSEVGLVELATDAEVVTGTDSARAVTPSALKYSRGRGARASRATDQTLSIATETKVLWTVEEWDDDSAFASSNFTVPETGRYVVSVSLNFGNMEDARGHNVRVKVDGTLVLQNTLVLFGTSNQSLAVCDVLNLTAGSVVNIYALAGGTTARTIVGNANTFFSIHRL